jgi:hypothetical protein
LRIGRFQFVVHVPAYNCLSADTCAGAVSRRGVGTPS